jgi:hypothetical protein
MAGFLTQHSGWHLKSCSVCGKQNLNPHRSQAEKEWRSAFLENVISDKEVRKEYLTAINAAYDEIRNKTAHPGTLPVPEYLLNFAGTKTYGLDESIQEFRDDLAALSSLALSIRSATWFLLTNKLFGLTTFPKLPSITFSSKWSK